MSIYTEKSTKSKKTHRSVSNVKMDNLAAKHAGIINIEKEIRRHNLEGSDGDDEDLFQQMQSIKMLEHK